MLVIKSVKLAEILVDRYLDRSRYPMSTLTIKQVKPAEMLLDRSIWALRHIREHFYVNSVNMWVGWC